MMKFKGYLFLSFSILFEVFATTMLKLTNGFTEMLPLVFTLLGYVLSFFLLGLTLKHISLSIAYAIWAGVGTVLTATISFLFWAESVTVLKGIALCLIIGGIVILNLSEEEKPAKNN